MSNSSTWIFCWSCLFSAILLDPWGANSELCFPHHVNRIWWSSRPRILPYKTNKNKYNFYDLHNLHLYSPVVQISSPYLFRKITSIGCSRLSYNLIITHKVTSVFLLTPLLRGAINMKRFFFSLLQLVFILFLNASAELQQIVFFLIKLCILCSSFVDFISSFYGPPDPVPLPKWSFLELITHSHYLSLIFLNQLSGLLHVWLSNEDKVPLCRVFDVSSLTFPKPLY